MHTLPKNAYILAICLSALAGCVDAIGFMQLSGHFVSFMSGNSTQLAVSLTTGNPASAALLGSVILLFVIGTVLGTLVRHFAKTQGPFMVLAFVCFLLVSAGVSYEAGSNIMAIAYMVLAMGAENAVFQRGGEVVVGVTYMTGTLVKMGQRMANAIVGGPTFAWIPYLLLWLGLMTGGVAGTLLFHFIGLHSLWIAALWSGGLAAAVKIMKISPG